MAENEGSLSLYRRGKIESIIRQWAPVLRKKVGPFDIYKDIQGLTKYDREQIECETRNFGDTRGMDKLLDCVGRRDPKCFYDFLKALKKNGYPDLANDIIYKENLTLDLEPSRSIEYGCRNSPNKRPLNAEDFSFVQNRYQNNQYLHYGQQLPLQPLGKDKQTVFTQRVTDPPNFPPQDVEMHHAHPQQAAPSSIGNVIYPPGTPRYLHVGPNPIPHQTSEVSQSKVSNRSGDTGFIPVPKKDDKYMYMQSMGDSDGEKKKRFSYDLDQEEKGQESQGYGSGFPSLKTQETCDHNPEIRPCNDQCEQGTGRFGQHSDDHSTGQFGQDGSPKINNADGQQLLQQSNHQEDVIGEVLTVADYEELAEILNCGDPPAWKKLGRKIGLKRNHMRDVESEMDSKRGEALLDLLSDKYGMTVSKLKDTFDKMGMSNAVQFLQGVHPTERNIDVSDEENGDDDDSFGDSLNKLDKKEPSLDKDMKNEDKDLDSDSCIQQDISQMQIVDKTFGKIEISTSKKPSENEYLMSDRMSDISKSSHGNRESESVSESEKSFDKFKYNQGDTDSSGGTHINYPAAPNRNNQVSRETTNFLTKVESDRSNHLSEKNSEMEASGLLKDVKFAQNEALEEQGANTSEEHLREDEKVNSNQTNSVLVVQAVDDATCSRSEKSPGIERENLHQEILNHQSVNPSEHVVRNLGQTYLMSGEGDLLSNQKSVDFSNVDTQENADDNSQLNSGVSENQFCNDIPEKSILDEELEAVACCSDKQQNDSDDFNKSGNEDIMTIPAKNSKACEISPEAEEENFKEAIQQVPVLAQKPQIDQTEETADAQSEVRPNTGSFRDVHNSLPQYKSKDLKNPDSSLPQNVDSLEFDDNETFLKEEHRPYNL